MIIIGIVLSLIIICMLFNYKLYYEVKGVVEKKDEDYYIRCYIPIEYLKYVTNNDIVKIDDLEYKYSVVFIDGEYFTDNITTYQIVKIEVDMSENFKFNNLTLKLKFLRDNKKIINYIIK